MGLFFRKLDLWLERDPTRFPERDVPMDTRWELLRRYGDFPLAYSSVSEAYLSTFGDARGMISFAQKMGVTYALGDPVAAAGDREPLLKEFVSAFGGPVFVACQRHTATALATLGYKVNVLGHESELALKGLDFSGGDFKRIRYASNWLETKGMTVKEEQDVSVLPRDLKQMSAQWKKSRVAKRQIRFLNREFTPKPLPDVRRFFAVSEDGRPAGFICFDPVYSDRRITGYLASQKRRVPDGNPYLDLAIMRAAIGTFQSEGIETVYMGLSPIADVSPADIGAEVAWLRRVFQAAHRSDWVNRRFFNSKGLAEYKNRFRGRRAPLYICLPPKGSHLLKVIGFLRLIRLV